MIFKQIEAIKKEIETDDEIDYLEVAIWLKDDEDSLNFVVDLVDFEYDLTEEWLYVKYNGGDSDSSINYSHLVKLSEIRYITSEV